MVTEGEAAKVIKWLPEMTRVLAPVGVSFDEGRTTQKGVDSEWKA